MSADIDKLLSTAQAIAWVWMCMHYLVSPLLGLLMHRVHKSMERS